MGGFIALFSVGELLVFATQVIYNFLIFVRNLVVLDCLHCFSCLPVPNCRPDICLFIWDNCILSLFKYENMYWLMIGIINHISMPISKEIIAFLGRFLEYYLIDYGVIDSQNIIFVWGITCTIACKLIAMENNIILVNETWDCLKQWQWNMFLLLLILLLQTWC